MASLKINNQNQRKKDKKKQNMGGSCTKILFYTPNQQKITYKPIGKEISLQEQLNSTNLKKNMADHITKKGSTWSQAKEKKRD